MFTDMELRSMNPLNGLSPAQSVAGSLRGFIMSEIWKPIPRCEGYEASSLGRIRKGKHVYKFSVCQGYFCVSVIEDGIRKTRRVSRLVARAFHGEPTAPMVLHRNGERQDNTPDNLYYGDAKQNYADSRRHGTYCHGVNHGRALLTIEQVISIKEEYAAGGESYQTLGDKYGVDKHTIKLIIKGKNWKDALSGHIVTGKV